MPRRGSLASTRGRRPRGSLPVTHRPTCSDYMGTFIPMTPTGEPTVWLSSSHTPSSFPTHGASPSSISNASTSNLSQNDHRKDLDNNNNNR